MRKNNLLSVAVVVLGIGLICGSARAQVTSFSYQGKLDEAGVPANGQYDFLFKLYQVPSGGSQVGSDFVRDNVQVTNGIFTTFMSFGTTPFLTSPLYYVEVAVRPGASTGVYTVLSPRTAIQTTPYSLKSFASDIATNATLLDGIGSSSFVQTGDPRLTDARNPLPNSPNYIQNSSGLQASANFNVGGNGTVAGNLSAGTVLANLVSTTTLGVNGNLSMSGGGSISVDTGPREGRFNESLMVFNDVGQTNVSTGVTTEVTNQLINIGANTGREGPFLSSRDGFWMRFDTRAGFNGIHFFKKASGTGTETAMVTIDPSGNMGVGVTAPSAKLEVAGTVRVGVIGFGGLSSVCFNGSLILSSCSSSSRYKTNIDNFSNGLDLIRRLRPVSFNWRDGGMPDLGLVAEEVAAIEPLLTTTNSKGETEGVKYDRVGVVLINAVKEQQVQIEVLKKQISALTALLCADNGQADVCRSKEQ